MSTLPEVNIMEMTADPTAHDDAAIDNNDDHDHVGLGSTSNDDEDAGFHDAHDIDQHQQEEEHIEDTNLAEESQITVDAIIKAAEDENNCNHQHGLVELQHSPAPLDPSLNIDQDLQQVQVDMEAALECQQQQDEHHDLHQSNIIIDSLQKEILSLKQTNNDVNLQLAQVINEHNLLLLKDKNHLAVTGGTDVSDLIHHEANNMDDGTQLSNYQSALAMSETQKSQLVAENQILRQRCVQAGIVINDVISPVQVATGEEKAAADLAIDITETEALATMESHSCHAHAHAHQVHPHQVHPHAHAHAHHQVHHHHAHHESMTPNTAGLSSRSEEKWESHFRDLAAYKEQHGNCLVPTSTELGRWLCRQRHNFRYKNLKEERKQRLMDLDKTCLGERIAELGSGTITDKDGNVTSLAGMPALHSPPPVNSKTKYNQAYESKLHEKWNKFFTELVGYKEKNGHCNFPTMNGSLGRWISRQRTLFRSKKLKADRYEKLVGIGFAFEDATALEFKGKLDQQWQDMYQKLLEHKETKGHCFDVPETLPLGKWLYRQRWLYRHGNLREDRAEKLLSVGFEDKKVLKKGGAVGVRDPPSGQPPRKKRKVEDLDNDLAAMTHDEGEEDIDDINANGDDNDNGNAHEEAVEEHTVAATELAEEGNKEEHSPEEVAPPLEENDELNNDGPTASV